MSAHTWSAQFLSGQLCSVAAAKRRQYRATACPEPDRGEHPGKLGNIARFERPRLQAEPLNPLKKLSFELSVAALAR